MTFGSRKLKCFVQQLSRTFTLCKHKQQSDKRTVYYNDQWLSLYKVIKGGGGVGWEQDTACKTLLNTNKKMRVIKNITNLEGCSLVVTFFFFLISFLLPDPSESSFPSTASLVSSDPRRSSCWPRCRSSPRTPPEKRKQQRVTRWACAP